MKLLFIGVWVTVVALATAYAAAVIVPGRAEASKVAAAVSLQYTKTRVLNVPMISGGVVQGFMAVQLGYTVDEAVLKAVHVPPEVYLLDEAFRALYADKALDFRDLAKYDLTKLTGHLVSATNDHLGAPVIRDVLIEQFSYISKETAKG